MREDLRDLMDELASRAADFRPLVVYREGDGIKIVASQPPAEVHELLRIALELVRDSDGQSHDQRVTPSFELLTVRRAEKSIFFSADPRADEAEIIEAAAHVLAFLRRRFSNRAVKQAIQDSRDVTGRVLDPRSTRN